jgi:2-methylcitrate dehydratase PrpD
MALQSSKTDNSITDRFIDGLYEFSQLQFGKDIYDRAKKCLLDYLGVTIAGSKIIESKINELYENIAKETGNIRLIGLNKKAGILEAALINGINSHVAELDDGERFGMFHPGAPIFSALIPAVQKYGINDGLFLKGIITGYETAIRLARALQPALKDKGFHGTGICGTIGAAIAIGIALDYTKKQLKDTLSAAATTASGLLKMLKDSSEMKPYNVGIAAQNALNAVLLTKSGFEGPADVLDGEKGYLSIFTGKYDTKQLFREDNEIPAITGIYMKPYAACRHCHAPIEAVINLKAKHNINHVQEIKSINIKTYRWAVEGHEHTKIASINSAKMSIPYCVAIALKTGRAGIHEFTPNWIKDESVIFLSEKVKVYSDDDLTALVPQKRSAVAELITVNGECFNERIDYPKGEPETPMSITDIEEKFLSLTSFSNKEKSVSEDILNCVWNIETQWNRLLQII